MERRIKMTLGVNLDVNGGKTARLGVLVATLQMCEMSHQFTFSALPILAASSGAFPKESQ